MINDGGIGLQDYKVKVDGVDINNAYFANNCMNFYIDIHLVPGNYEVSILKLKDYDAIPLAVEGLRERIPEEWNLDLEYVALNNTGGLTYIHVTILPSYTFEYIY